MSFGLMLAGFLAATNAGRVALAGGHGMAAALAVGATAMVAAVLAADALLDALAISPESFRIAAAIVLAAAGAAALVRPRAPQGPFAAILLTPELVMVALAFGSTEPAGRVLAAAALTLPGLLLAGRGVGAAAGARTMQFLAALQIVVAVALAVSGIRDV